MELPEWSAASAPSTPINQTDSSSPLNKTGSVRDGMDLPAVVGIMMQCFGLILIGYLAGRRGMINRDQSHGVSMFVARFALPALIFTSLATFDLSQVDWQLIALIFFSKTFVFVAVAIVTMILTRPVDLAKSAIYAMFCTQGNDFAIGYPILMMLYGSGDKPSTQYPNYLYILAPIQLLILNPIACVLLEYQRSTSNLYRYV